MTAKKQKWYVVWAGRVPGVYTSWADTLQQVQGAAGAVYKSFESREEAYAAYAREASHYVSGSAARAVGAGGKVVGDAPKKAKPAPRIGVGTSKASAVGEAGTSDDTSPADKAQASAPTPLPSRGPRMGRSKGGKVVNPPTDRTDTVLPLPPAVVAEAWAVDAACSGNPGQMEYRGVCLRTGVEVFHVGPLLGTNNIGEFLAIVHALALAETMADGAMRPTLIYTDSRNAIGWVSKKLCKTTLEHTPKTTAVHDLIARAERWLTTHHYRLPIVKWDTRQWGEVPADFGRKG